MEVGLHEPCLPYQRANICDLWQKLGRTQDQLRETIVARGKAKLAELTVEEATQFIAALAKKLGLESAPF